MISKIFKIDHVFSLLVYLIPYTLVAGNSFADVNICLLGIIFIIKLSINKDYSILKNKFSLFFILFYSILLSSSFLSSNIILSLESSLFYFRYYFYVMAIYYGLKYDIFKIKYLIYNFLFIISLLLLDGFYQYFSGYNILNYKWDGDRLSSLFGEEKILGSFLSRIMPFILAIIFSIKKNTKLVYFSLLLLVASDVLIVISGDRTAAFYLFLSTLIIIILIDRFKILRLITFIFSLILIFVIIQYSKPVKERIIEKTINEFVVNNEEQNQKNLSFFNKLYFFTPTHTNYAKVSLKMFYDKPLFGVGPKLYRYECLNSKYFVDNKQYCNTHPHNTYLQLLAETGIVGFLFIFIFLLWTIKKLIYQLYFIIVFNKYYYSSFLICILVTILISIFPIVPSGSFFNQWLNVIYFLPIGFLLNEIIEKKDLK